ncbi:MAG: anti-sigma-F factor Fin [Bacillota bacterium]
MHLEYHCNHCGKLIREMTLDSLDPVALGFNVLTPEERVDIIKVDSQTGHLRVASICDDCLKEVGLALCEGRVTPYLH